MSLIMTFMFEPAKLQMDCRHRQGGDERPRGATELAVFMPEFAGVALMTRWSRRR